MNLVVAHLPTGPRLMTVPQYIAQFVAPARNASTGTRAPTSRPEGALRGAAGSTVHDARAARRPGPLSP